MLRSVRFGCVVTSLALSACVVDAGHDTDEEPHEPIGQTSQALTKNEPVSAAVTQSCSTTSVKGLSTQLVEEIQCLRPNTLKRIDNVEGVKLGAAVFPWLQTPVADALMAAQKARGVTLSLNSGLRTLPQQYLLYRWYQTGRCGIGLAASPGRSNHESAVAIDIQDNAAWRSALQSKGFRWLGANDPVHFDYTGGGAVDLRGLSVRAFQRLWNRNHPEDMIDEDGLYGLETEERLARSPVGGFPIGAKCDEPKKEMDEDPGEPMPAELPIEPDATEPDEGEGAEEAPHGDHDDHAGKKGANDAPRAGRRPSVDSGGCSMVSCLPTERDAFGVAAGLVALGVVMTRRRRERASSW